MGWIEIALSPSHEGLGWTVTAYRSGASWLMGRFCSLNGARGFAIALASANGMEIRTPTASVIDFRAALAAREGAE